MNGVRYTGTQITLALNSFSEQGFVLFVFHQLSAVCEKSTVILLIYTGKQVWHSAYDRFVWVGFDVLIVLFNDKKIQMQSEHLIQKRPISLTASLNS